MISRRFEHPLLALFLRGTPTLTAAQAGGFRIALAASMAVLHFGFITENSAFIRGWVVPTEYATAFHTCAAVLYLLFACGVLTRVTHLLAVAAFFTHVWFGTHAITPFLIGALMTLASPLGHGFSVDAWVTRIKPYANRQIYGFAPWAFGLTLSFAYGFAALSKVRVSGLDWILYGVFEAFVIDAGVAPTDIGVWILNQPVLVTLLSVGALLTEFCWLAVPFVRRRWQLLIGLPTSLALIVGFILLQGHFWMPYGLALCLFFFPWSRLPLTSPMAGRDNHESRLAKSLLWLEPREPLSKIVLASGLLLVLTVQVYAVIRAGERPPFWSHYPMYNRTAPPDSRQQFIAQWRETGRASRYRVILHHHDDRQEDITNRLVILHSTLLRRAIFLRVARLFGKSGAETERDIEKLKQEILAGREDIAKIRILREESLFISPDGVVSFQPHPAEWILDVSTKQSHGEVADSPSG